MWFFGMSFSSSSTQRHLLIQFFSNINHSFATFKFKWQSSYATQIISILPLVVFWMFPTVLRDTFTTSGYCQICLLIFKVPENICLFTYLLIYSKLPLPRLLSFFFPLKPPNYSFSLLCFSFFYFLIIMLLMIIKTYSLITSYSNVTTTLVLREPRSEITFAWPKALWVNH